MPARAATFVRHRRRKRETGPRPSSIRVVAWRTLTETKLSHQTAPARNGLAPEKVWGGSPLVSSTLVLTTMETSAYGYWVDNHANIHPVPPSLDHSDVARKLLGDKWEKAQAMKWIRVSVYKTDGALYFDYDINQPPSPAQMRALRELEAEHGLKLFDEETQRFLESIRPRWDARSGQ